MYALWSLPWQASPHSKELLRFASADPVTSFPTAPELAADALLSDLDSPSVEALTRIELEQLPLYDQPLGDYCRRVLGLDGRNQALMEACGHADPNDAIGVIVRLAWIKAYEARNPR